MALGITIRRGHVILAAGLLLYNISSNQYAKFEERKAVSDIVKKCNGKTPPEIQEIIDNPKDAYRFVSAVYPNEDCVPTSRLYKALLGRKYSPKILSLKNRGFRNRYTFEFHNICVFNEDDKVSSLDSIFGYIGRQKSVGDIIKIIEKKAGIKNTIPDYNNNENGIPDITQTIQILDELRSEKIALNSESS
jgi:hypothetical protein